MARKKPITEERLSAPRRCSPRFLPNNSPQHSNPNSPVAHLPKNSNLKFVGSTIHPILRRSARLIGETKGKQEEPKIGNYGEINKGFSNIGFGGNLRRRVLLEVKKDELCNEVLGNVVKRVTRRGGSTNENVGVNRGDNRCEDVGKDEKLGRIEECGYIGKRVTRRGGSRNGSFECDRGDNWCEDVGNRGCKDVKLGRVEGSGCIGKRVTRSVFRNGSDCERNRLVDCKEGGSCSLSGGREGGGFRDEKSKRVVRESRMVSRRVTSRASLRNGSEYEERNRNVDCNAEDNCPLSEHLGGGGSKGVVKEPTLILKRVTRGASHRTGSEYEQKNGNADCNAGDKCPLSEHLNGVVEEKKSKRVVKGSRLISRRVTRSANHRNGIEYEVIDDNVKDCDADNNAKEENVGKKQLGRKRKKNQQNGDCGCISGWTKEQEVALQKAYFAVKPTPHFWKKVAKMVNKYQRGYKDKVASFEVE